MNDSALAPLGFEVDSAPILGATVALDKFVDASFRVDVAADRLEEQARALGFSMSKIADGAKSAQAPLEAIGRSFQQQDQHVQQFRMELDRLTLKYQPLAQASRNYEATVAEINRAHQLGVISAGQMQKALDAERLAYDRLKMSAQSAGNAVDAANQNRGGRTSFNTSNLAAQGFDVATTAAFMPWYTVALQQGPQVSQVFNDIRASGQSIGPAVAGAFAQILNPLSLVTIGVIGGAAALIQYFTTAEDGATKTSKLFAEQNEVIRKAAELWGDAVPGLKAYVDELDRADKITSGKEAGDILAGRELDGLSEHLDSIKRQALEAFRSLQGDPNNVTIVRDLRTAWGDLRTGLDDGSASMADLNRVQRELANAVEKYGTPQVLKFRDAFDEQTAAIYRSIEAADKARSAYIAALAGGTNVQDIVSGATFTDNGKTYRTADFEPLSPGVPSRRPLVELEGLPGAGTETPAVINSDGNLVNVPIPGRRPNYFERESDLPNSFSSFRANRNTYWSRDVLDEEQRRAAMGGLFKGFITDFGDALRNNSGDLGKALMEGLSSAVANAASQAWEKFANLGANMLVNAILGQPSTGLMNKGIGFSGANTTLGQILGAGGGLASNDNVAGGFSGLASVPTTDIAAYIRDGAIKRGIDPNIALKVAQSEGGLNSWNLQSSYYKNGVREQSYGPFQLYKGGGLGNSFMDKTGLDPALAANGPAATDFALDHAAKNGWGAWYGAAKVGVGKWDGIGTGGTATDAVNKLAEAAGSATKGLDTFGGGLGKIGESLSTNFFPAAPSAPSGGGGGGGLFGWLGGLFSPNLSKYAGLTGLFADGTNYAPGGMAIVGERGPELVNLPQGSQVFDTNRSARMMAGGRDGGGSQRPIQNFYLDGARGDDHIRELARQGAQEGIAQAREADINGGFGDTQKKYNSRVG